MSRLDVLVNGLMERYRSTGLTASQIKRLFTARPGKSTGFRECWLLALMTFVTTGNLYQAAIAFLECVIGSDNQISRSQGSRYKVRGTIILISMMGNSQKGKSQLDATRTDNFIPCLFELLISLFTGTPLDEALINFIACLIGDGNGGNGCGEIPDFEDRQVDRC